MYIAKPTFAKASFRSLPPAIDGSRHSSWCQIPSHRIECGARAIRTHTHGAARPPCDPNLYARTERSARVSFLARASPSNAHASQAVITHTRTSIGSRSLGALPHRHPNRPAATRDPPPAVAIPLRGRRRRVRHRTPQHSSMASSFVVVDGNSFAVATARPPPSPSPCAVVAVRPRSGAPSLRPNLQVDPRERQQSTGGWPRRNAYTGVRGKGIAEIAALAFGRAGLP